VNDQTLVDIVKDLTSISGISGHESAAVERAATYFGKYCDKMKLDRFGNLVAMKKADRVDENRIIIALVAHIDEIGALVTSVEKGGFLRFTPVGGIDPRVLPGQAVVVHGKDNYDGVIGATAPHLLTDQESKKTVPIEKLFIDTGYSFDFVNAHIKVGDPVSLGRKTCYMEEGHMITGKALDNRAGVASLILCAAELGGLHHQADVCFIASLQEEVGLRGAITAAYGLNPDLAVAVDVTHGDVAGVDEKYTFKPGQGPVIAVGPNFHPVLSEELQHIAGEYNLSRQLEAIPGNSHTDAWAIQVSREGTPTGLVSIPLRYMHSTVEMVAVSDLISTGRLLAWLISGMNSSFIGRLKGC
jgi:endoglucanase